MVESAVPSPVVESYQNYLKRMKIVDLNKRGTMGNDSGAEGNNTSIKRKAHAEGSQIAWGIAKKWDPDRTLSGLSQRWATKSGLLSWQKQTHTPFDNTPADKIDAIETRIPSPAGGYLADDESQPGFKKMRYQAPPPIADQECRDEELQTDPEKIVC